MNFAHQFSGQSRADALKKTNSYTANTNRNENPWLVFFKKPSNSFFLLISTVAGMLWIWTMLILQLLKKKSLPNLSRMTLLELPPFRICTCSLNHQYQQNRLLVQRLSAQQFQLPQYHCKLILAPGRIDRIRLWRLALIGTDFVSMDVMVFSASMKGLCS